MNIQVRDSQTNDAGSGEQLLTDAVRVLSDAVRSTGDFAEFVTLAVAGAAANVGGIEQALAGRPGSWEAHYVREMLTSTVGYDQQYLHEHRTEPLVVRVHVDDVLHDLGLWALYDAANDELNRRENAICARHDIDEPIEDYDPNDYAALDELEQLRNRLDRQQKAEWATYGNAFRDNVHRAAAELFPTLPVPVEAIVEQDWQNDLGPAGDDWDGPAWRVWDAARLDTPLPGSGIPPRDYPVGADIAQVERNAGRTPLARLDAAGGELR
jgi:hypothetical protein